MKTKPLMLSIAGVAFVVLAWLALSGRSRPVEWFLTPDQIAAQALKRGDYRLAAEMFTDPMWRGVALFKAGEFDEAAAAFAQRSTPEAHFNQGNAWLMRGNYESAIEGYDRALTLRPAWTEAEENRDLARARAERTKAEGGDLGDQRLGADEIVFDRKEDQGGQETEVSGEKAMSQESVQALWLRRVQTKPADFLRTKFAQQYAMEQEQPK